MGDEGTGKMAEALKVNQSLQTIHLGGNEIGAKGAGKLAEALADALCQGVCLQRIYRSVKEVVSKSDLLQGADTLVGDLRAFFVQEINLRSQESMRNHLWNVVC